MGRILVTGASGNVGNKVQRRNKAGLLLIFDWCRK